MAGELGISTSAYSKIERGVTDPSIGRITEIAKILEVNITYFFKNKSIQTGQMMQSNLMVLPQKAILKN